jgi:hypothetical protein
LKISEAKTKHEKYLESKIKVVQARDVAFVVPRNSALDYSWQSFCEFVLKDDESWPKCGRDYLLAV